MIIVNSKLDGENTYNITVGTSATYQVSAFDLESALDILADYLVRTKSTNLYVDDFGVKVMAEYSDYGTTQAFAKAHNLVCCGTNNIYLEITSVKGYLNG